MQLEHVGFVDNRKVITRSLLNNNIIFETFGLKDCTIPLEFPVRL
jgi:hypothetical protein